MKDQLHDQEGHKKSPAKEVISRASWNKIQHKKFF